MFHKVDKGEYNEQIRRDVEIREEKRERLRQQEVTSSEKKKANEREAARLRKEKSRGTKRQREIESGIRDGAGKIKRHVSAL